MLPAPNTHPLLVVLDPKRPSLPPRRRGDAHIRAEPNRHDIVTRRIAALGHGAVLEIGVDVFPDAAAVERDAVLLPVSKAPPDFPLSCTT